ncbi:hypothetical protein [Pyrococcus kukulkanii]|uniref:CARDB domain-containing protein n=1 Tax=Pyrococcus kukulkanii TaxID=1609559 RepID=A0A127B780_9EURY|nr:hypothetical protein [Pyrococcus kukulkanii]AMM53222.1 hypothetical protein TQ32_00960 [Pyrococcus kukulkanii]
MREGNKFEVLYPGLNPLGCDKEKTIVERYSEDFEVKKQEVDTDKIELSIYPSPEHPKTFQDVTFYVTITNDNDKEISGKCTVYIALPEGTGRYSKDVIVPASSSKTFEIAKVRYGKPGTYGYGGVFKFGQFEVSASGSVTVSQDSSGSSGSLKIKQVTFEPSLPKVQDNVKVRVKVSNSYSSKKTVKVELVVDGKTVNQVDGVVSGGKEREFILSWTPTGAGEYGWIVYLYEKSANNVYLKKDSKSGRIEVTRINSPFSVRLYAYPTELEGGGEVTFLVKVWNYGNDRVSLKGFVSDGDGAIVKNINWTGVPANAQNYTVTTFTLTVYGVGEHKYKLFLDNYDGKPNGKGEEHWSEVRVEVKPWQASLKLECDGKVILGKDDVDDLDCTLYLFRTNPSDSVQVKISEIYVGGAKVWPSNFEGIIVSKEVLKVTPYDPDDETHIELTIDENFAEFYFGIDPLFPWHSYVDKLATDRPWEIVLHFENAPPISATFRILKNSGISPEDVVEYGGSGTFIATEILERAGYITTEATGLGKVAVVGSKLFGYVGLLFFLTDIVEEAYFYGCKQPRDSDNDGFVG